MKLGVFALSYAGLAEQGMSSLEMVDMAAEQGFASFEPYPYEDMQTVGAARSLGAAVREKGMAVPCFSTGVDLIGEDHAAQMDRMKLYIEMASAMGSPYFHHTIHPQLSIDGNTPALHEAMEEAVPRLKELCLYAAERNVTCLYEEQGMLFNGVAACRMLEQAMGDVPFGFCLDAGNIYFVDERPADFAVAFPHRIRHIHLKDYYLKDGSRNDPGEGWLGTRRGDYLRDAIVGHGDIDYGRLMRIIRTIGYDGYFSLEYCGPEPHEYAIPQSMTNIKKYYGESDN